MGAVPLIGPAELQRLAADPSPEARAATAAKLARDFDDDRFTSAEIEQACAIFRLLVRDTAIAVREALATVLRANPWLPRDIALSLANDIDRIALPFLELSPAITPADLLDIIRSQRSQTKMRAIAGRPLLQEEVVSTLVECGDEEVAATLVGNTSAIFSEAALGRVLDRFGTVPEINEPLGLRFDLPPRVLDRVLDRVLALVTDAVRDRLVAYHELDGARVMALVQATSERATLNLAREFSVDGRAALISQLRNAGKLTPSLLLRAVCLGHLSFFEDAVTALVDYLPARASVLLRNPHGIDAMCRRANMPTVMIPAVISALGAARALEAEGRDLTADAFSQRVVERVMTECETIGVGMEEAEIEFLLARIATMAQS